MEMRWVCFGRGMIAFEKEGERFRFWFPFSIYFRCSLAADGLLWGGEYREAQFFSGGRVGGGGGGGLMRDVVGVRTRCGVVFFGECDWEGK